MPSGIKVNKQLVEADFNIGGGYSTRIKKIVEQRLKEGFIPKQVELKDIV